MPASTAAPRRSRFWLYLPFILLAVVAVLWSAFWFVVRDRVTTAVDTALARELERGRSWSCADRSVTGYPFRVELRCSGLTLTSNRWGDEVRITTGPLVALGQIYTPRQVILQMTGPMQATLPGGRNADIGWSRLEASARLSMSGPERVSLVAHEPVVTLRSPEPDGSLRSESARSTMLEAHLRPNPQGFAGEHKVDVSLAAAGVVAASFDALLLQLWQGDADPETMKALASPGDYEVQATVSQALAFRGGFNPQTLESWRLASGLLEVTRLALAKGTMRLEARGLLALDEARRPAGRIMPAVAGIDRIGGMRIGGLMSGLGAVLGGGKQQEVSPGMTPLPAVALREGRVFVGPLRLPLAPLAPLY